MSHDGALYQTKFPTPRKQPVIVLGATGFVGRTLVELWPQGERANLRLIVHRSRPSWIVASGAEVRTVANDDQLVEVITDGAVIVNLLRPSGNGWLEAISRRITAQAAKVSGCRILHCSSTDVYGDVTTNLIDEETYPRPRTAYEREHLAAEQITASARVESAILRFGAVFGPGGRNLLAFAEEARHASRAKLMARRALYGNRRLHLVSVEKAAAALRFLALIDRPLCAERFLVTDDDAPENNFAFIQDALLRAFGRPELCWVPVLPDNMMAISLRLRGRSNCNPQRRFATTKLEALGFRPDEKFRTRLEKYAATLACAQNVL